MGNLGVEGRDIQGGIGENRRAVEDGAKHDKPYEMDRCVRGYKLR